MGVFTMVDRGMSAGKEPWKLHSRDYCSCMKYNSHAAKKGKGNFNKAIEQHTAKQSSRLNGCSFNVLEWGRFSFRVGSFFLCALPAELFPFHPSLSPCASGQWNGAVCDELSSQPASLCMSFLCFHSVGQLGCAELRLSFRVLSRS